MLKQIYETPTLKLKATKAQLQAIGYWAQLVLTTQQIPCDDHKAMEMRQAIVIETIKDWLGETLNRCGEKEELTIKLTKPQAHSLNVLLDDTFWYIDGGAALLIGQGYEGSQLWEFMVMLQKQMLEQGWTHTGSSYQNNLLGDSSFGLLQEINTTHDEDE